MVAMILMPIILMMITLIIKMIEIKTITAISWQPSLMLQFFSAAHCFVAWLHCYYKEC